MENAELPKEVRTHKIVDYYYCAERSRLAVLYGFEPPITAVMEAGLTVHNWLENRPRSKAEAEVWEKIKFMEPLHRAFEGVKIIGHPDDLTVLNGKVQIIEYKTVDNLSPKPWKTSLAKFQLQIYAWIMEPILKNLNRTIVHTHKVIYLTRSGVFFKKQIVEHDPWCTERKIREIFKFWVKGEPLIPPLKWKCRICPDIFKSKCRILQEG